MNTATILNGHTRLTGLLGSPVSHSISPLMHNEAFRLLGLNYAYLCFEATEATLPETIHALKCLNARGFNCTMPVKTRMYELADELSPAASLMKAVNTVIIENGKFIGHNTDGVGYMSSVKEAGYDITGKKMTLLGAGGAATAIAVQAALDQVSEIAIFNRKSRSWQRAQELTDLLNKNTACRVTLHDLADCNELRRQLSDSAILTNATNVGMAPHADASPIPDASMLHENLIVSDIIYNPRETQLIAQAKQRGCASFNGLYMLLFQGAEAFRLWTGCDMPVKEIRQKFFT